jgi:hypothetical protein
VSQYFMKIAQALLIDFSHVGRPIVAVVAL